MALSTDKCYAEDKCTWSFKSRHVRRNVRFETSQEDLQLILLVNNHAVLKMKTLFFQSCHSIVLKMSGILCQNCKQVFLDCNAVRKYLYSCRICVLLRTTNTSNFSRFRRNLLCRVCVHATDWSYCTSKF